MNEDVAKSVDTEKGTGAGEGDATPPARADQPPSELPTSLARHSAESSKAASLDKPSGSPEPPSYPSSDPTHRESRSSDRKPPRDLSGSGSGPPNFPSHANTIAVPVDVDRSSRPRPHIETRSKVPSSLPAVGDRVLGFRLKAELGRGSFAGVFLAEQVSLAGRPVVVKISAIQGQEPYTLAQLQHTHIVPIYSLHEDARKGLRLVCMPYFGGASLARILKTMWKTERQPRQGSTVVEALGSISDTAVARPESIAAPFMGAASGTAPVKGAATDGASKCGIGGADGSDTPLKMLGTFSYIQATAWIMARLAEGLHHAHQRGVLHRDIKPANVLISDEGQPMLLDFNMAQRLADDSPSSMGGTIAYMPPEQLRGMNSRKAAGSVRVDQRSDIYSLGLVFYEMLTGESPLEQCDGRPMLPLMFLQLAKQREQEAPSARQKREDVPWGIESILRKCLAPDPDQRYQQAEHLAEDLRRFCDDRPLKYAPELSRKERLQKWARRHPKLSSSATVTAVAAAIVLAISLGLFAVYGWFKQLEAERKFSEFQDRAVAATCLINTQVARLEGSEHLTLLDNTEKGIEVCRAALGIYGVLDDSDWQERSAWERLDASKRRAAAEEMHELLIMLADARFSVAARKAAIVPPEIVDEALTTLAKAETLPDIKPCPALYTERARFLDYLANKHRRNTAEEAQEARRQSRRLPPTTARDHCLIALIHLRDKQLDKAIDHLQQAVQIDKQYFWAWYRLGLCRYELGQFERAEYEYNTCAALWPEFPWIYLNRGMARAHQRDLVRAVQDYDEALRLDPYFGLAYLNRALAHQQMQDHGNALRDIEQAIRLNSDLAASYATQGISLEALGRHKEADEAFDRAFALRADDMNLRLQRGSAIAKRAPRRALADFDKVLDRDPDSVVAWYGKGCALMELSGREADALKCFQQALQRSPDWLPALRARAIVKARLGQFAAACVDADRCYELDPRNGETCYQVACVYALRSKKDSDAAEKAVDYLRQAFRLGYGQDRFEKDADLNPLRQHPAYRQLLDDLERLKVTRGGV